MKEIYDKVKELKTERGDEIVVLNQFEEIGNSLWHYAVTGPAMQEVFQSKFDDKHNLRALFLTQGSAGTLGSGDFLKTQYPTLKIGAGEALQCPTLLYNGYGAHRIEGIGDKHVPWIHNMKNTDMVAAIDDELVMNLMRLFNEDEGHQQLSENGISTDIIEKLDLFGISSIANIVGAIKMAKYYEMNENDVVVTIATDSMEMYQSRLAEARKKFGEYTAQNAVVDYKSRLLEISTDNLLELSYYDRKRMHNLKYFTWVEQQGKTVEELNAQWYDEDYWTSQYAKVDEWDEKIIEFNKKTGLI